MTFEWWFSYLVATFIFSVAPGPGLINTLSNGISYGFRSTLWSIIGLQLGLFCSILFVGIGLGTLISQSLLAFSILKWVGAVYLIFLGIQLWQAPTQINVKSNNPLIAPQVLFRRGILVNITNPKSILFLAALFPLFIKPEQPQTIQYLIIGTTMIVVDMSVMITVAYIAKQLTRFISTPAQMKRMNRLFAALFILVSFYVMTAHQ